MPTKPARDAARAAIEAAVRAIPLGRVSSYGAVARQAGLPGRARLVGHVLRTSVDGELPWQRVLHADGRLAAPVGTALARLQARRLAAEGVAVHRGRVPAVHFAEQRDLDAALWRFGKEAASGRG